MATVARHWLGIDIGGTFTDFALFDTQTGELVGLKVPSTPHEFAAAVRTGLERLADEHGVDLREIGTVVHGTTIAVNTLIQRTGARLGLLVTEGFRDVLELQRLRMPNPFDLHGSRPLPLIPRARVAEVRERLRADGTIDTPLDERSVRDAVQQLTCGGQSVEGLVISLLHSYRRPEHEQKARAIAEQTASGVPVTASSDVWPQAREYERTALAVLDAYVQPKVQRYLEGFEQALAARGAPAVPHVTKSNGGIMPVAAARNQTAATLLSGPASGVIGAAYVAGRAGFPNIITLDVGGTSADMAVVENGRPRVSTSEHIGGVPVMMPVVGVSAIGAGGGSVAWVDDVGLPKVGPQSTGAEPGPACYGRGGKDATLTDAFLVSGFLDPERFLGGRMRLDRSLAEAAIARFAGRLGMTPDEAAESIVRVAVSNMYAEFTKILSRAAVDPRGFSLVAFGGAGPVVGALVAREVGIPAVFVPRSPGTLCALGALSADIVNDAVRTVHTRVETELREAAVLRRQYDDLRAELSEWLARFGAGAGPAAFRHAADMRYVGQSYEIDVPVELGWLAPGGGAPLLAAFHRAHERAFGHADREAPAEIVNLRIQLRAERQRVPLEELPAGAAAPVARAARRIWLDGRPTEARVYDRSALGRGARLEGPAIVEQPDTTVLVPGGHGGEVDRFGNLLLREGKLMRLDALTVEILRNYLQGAVEEMAYVVERTAYTTFVKETADFTCGLLNPSGEFFAYPVELGVASFGGISYAETLEAVGPLEPGDVVITNDPYGSAAAATHLPDIHLVKPIFWEDRLVAYGAGFLHSSDVGGMVPASITPRASEIFQEGLRLPPKKLFKRGEVNRDLLDVILANCRIPEQNWGDLQALVAGLTTGERRMHELIRRFGPDTVDKAMDDLIDYATRKVEALIRKMPAGRYEFSDYIEDDVVTKIPIRLKVALTIADGEIHLDFTGSDIQVSSALNVPTAGKVHPFMSVALVNYFATRDRTIPLNAGVLRRVRMTLPEGSVVNPKFPAACGVRYATVLRIYDAVLGALARAVPEDIPAASGGQGCMVALSLPDPAAGRRHVTVIEPMIGGGGGRPARDGVDGCDASLGFLKTTPAETLEAEVPIVVRRFHLIPDSAGPGRFRGGFGVRLDFQVFQPEGLVTARGMERLRFAPWGVAGGTAGATGSVMLNPGTAAERTIPKIDVLALEPGDVLSVRTPGGGGHGDRFTRPPSHVLTDVLSGLVSRERARDAYGVVIDGDRVDEAATASLRAAHADRVTIGAGTGAVFDFGAARREHEQRWPSELQDAFIAMLMSLPAPYRAYVRRTLYGRVEALAAERPVTTDDLHRLLNELRAAIALK